MVRDKPNNLDVESNESKPTPEPSENFLARYFKEMAQLSVLKPEEEFECARHIEAIEVSLWAQVLSYPPVLDAILSITEAEQEKLPKSVSTLRRKASAFKSRPTVAQRNRYTECCEQVGRQLHDADVDRRTLFAVLMELGKIARGDVERRYNGRLHVNTQSKVFKDYMRRVRVGFGRSQRARNDFVKANLRLVVSIARRFNHGRMPLSDLIQEGNVGLIKAVERYDYRRGYRFSTYASWWIRHSISRALADKGRAVRLPVHMIDAYHKVSRTRRELSSKLGRPPTQEEVSSSAGISSDKVQKLEGYLMEQAVSLDREVSGEDGRRFIDFMHDPEAELPSDRVMERALNDQVLRLLEMDLKPIEADILRKRFGLGGTPEQTLKEIGQAYNLSRERIRQLQEQALSKIRRGLQRQDAI
ncbi:MAG: sigma-70 family RNA polymerase sigma factor [Myxococcales bacterium]|nr:sigma-70 family RNA polymerase sigma factor [Myxococcales bacterium]